MKDRIVLIALTLITGFILSFIHFIIPIDRLYIVVLLAAIYTLMLSIAFTHQRRKRKKRPQRLNYHYEPNVCIMIPAHNEESVIARTIENIMQLDYQNFEVIVIDDRSTDNTASILLDLEKNYDGKLKVLIRDKNAFPGKSAVLNDALKLSNQEVICVFDADAKIKPDFLKILLPYLAPEDVGAVQARKIINNKDINLLTRCQNNEYTLDTQFQISRDSINGAVELRGNGFLVKRAALEEVGGWTNNTITDDLDLSTKLHLQAWGVRFCPAAEVYEEAITKFIPLLKQRRRWVEGSLRRYLDYFFEILTSDIISLRVGFDMIAFLLEFILPVIIIFQFCLQFFYFVKNVDNQLISIISVAFGMGVFFFFGLIFALRQYNKLSLFQSIKQSIETSFYMILLWMPLVTIIVFKVLFTKRDMKWGKTSHGLAKE